MLASRETEPTLVVTVNGKPLPHVVLHSPTGYDWGYGGSGAADLALSILTHYLGDRHLAELLHQEFKWDVVAGLKHRCWVLTGAEIAAWLRERGIHVGVRDVVYEGRRRTRE
ncbi:MAG TPA: DUF6166 domain-containing protein [Thermaerobacter sp.]